MVVCGLAIAAIPVISALTGSSDRPVSAKAPQVPKATPQMREVSFWTRTTTFKPAPPRHADRSPVELGTRFTAAQDGWVAGVRFFKAAGEKGTHTGSLWDAKGERLASVSFTAESSSGWQEARFGKTVPIKAGEVYIVSYHSDHGTYAGRPSATPLRSGPLSSAKGRTGVYMYGKSRFPHRSNPRNYNYFVDPIYQWWDNHPTWPPASTPAPSVPPTPSAGPKPEKPSPKPTPSPSTSKPSTPPAEPSYEPSGSCPGYPTPDCTGVPAGTDLVTKRPNDGGAYRVKTPGTVLDGVRIPGDLLITANNVTVKNSRIDGTVINEWGTTHYSFKISDSTVGPASGCLTAPGVGESEFTATRVLVRGHGDGFRASGDDIVIRDSYVHLCSRPGDHSDGIQTYMTGKGLVFQHNTVDQRDAKDITAPIFITDPGAVNVTVADNLIMGGTYALQVKNASGTVVVRDNKLVNKSWVYGPVEADCSSINWSGNSLVTIDDDYRVTSTVGPLPCRG
jgi:hypothetical protein